jgi:hypothetical protein
MEHNIFYLQSSVEKVKGPFLKNLVQTTVIKSFQEPQPLHQLASLQPVIYSHNNSSIVHRPSLELNLISIIAQRIQGDNLHLVRRREEGS